MQNKIRTIIREATQILREKNVPHIKELKKYLSHLERYKKETKAYKQLNKITSSIIRETHSTLTEKEQTRLQYCFLKINHYLRSQNIKDTIINHPHKKIGFLLQSHKKYKVVKKINGNHIILNATGLFHSKRNKVNGQILTSILGDQISKLIEREDLDVDYLHERDIYTKKLRKEFIDREKEYIAEDELDKEDANLDPSDEDLIESERDYVEPAYLFSRLLVYDKPEDDLDHTILKTLTDHFITLIEKNPELIIQDLKINLYIGNLAKRAGYYYKIDQDLIEIFIKLDFSALQLVANKIVGTGIPPTDFEATAFHELGHLYDTSLKKQKTKKIQRLFSHLKSEGIAEALSLIKTITVDTYESHPLTIEGRNIVINSNSRLITPSNHLKKVNLKRILQQVQSGKKSVDEAYNQRGQLHYAGYKIMFLILLHELEEKATCFNGDLSLIEELDDATEDYSLITEKEAVKNLFDPNTHVFFEVQDLKRLIKHLKHHTLLTYFKLYAKACKKLDFKEEIPFYELLLAIKTDPEIELNQFIP